MAWKLALPSKEYSFSPSLARIPAASWKPSRNCIRKERAMASIASMPLVA